MRALVSAFFVALLAASVAAADPAPSTGKPRSTAVAHATRVGPVADFGPHQGIATHVLLDDMETDLGRRLSRRLGRDHIIEDYSPAPEDPGFEEAGTLLWMRDFQPIFVRQADGTVVALRYLSENRTRRSFYLADSESILLPSGDDHELGTWFPVKTLPIVHENGNLVSTGKHIFLADTVLADNEKVRDNDELIAAGYRPREPHETVALLAEYFGRPAEDIIILPRLPGEATGHVDIFLLALDEDTVMLPEIRAEALALVETDEEFDQALAVRDFLDEQAALLTSRGVTVKRLPMLAPRFLPSVSADEEETLDLVVFTPANSLLVRSKHTATAFVPRFSLSEDLTWVQKRLQRRYESDWAHFFRQTGWRVDSAEASELARYLGLVRCVTAPIPERAL